MQSLVTLKGEQGAMPIRSMEYLQSQCMCVCGCEGAQGGGVGVVGCDGGRVPGWSSKTKHIWFPSPLNQH
jgi:hypothetical protein